jgi:hypothetical protein
MHSGMPSWSSADSKCTRICKRAAKQNTTQSVSVINEYRDDRLSGNDGMTRYGFPLKIRVW